MRWLGRFRRHGCLATARVTRRRPGTASCPSPTDVPGLRAFVVKGLSNSTQFSVYWHARCTRGGTVAEGACDDVQAITWLRSPRRAERVHPLADRQRHVDRRNDRSLEGDWRWEWSEGPDGSRFWSGGGERHLARLRELAERRARRRRHRRLRRDAFSGTGGQWQDRTLWPSLDFVCRALDRDPDDDDTLRRPKGHCTYLGNAARRSAVRASTKPRCPGSQICRAVEQALGMPSLHGLLHGSDPPTPAQQLACRNMCTDPPGTVPQVKPCSGDAAPPDPLTSVPCEVLDDYELFPTTLTEPPPEKRCPIIVPEPPDTFTDLVPCVNHQYCIDIGMPVGMRHCGEVFHCRDCNPADEDCVQCAGAVSCLPVVPACPSRIVDGEEQNLCVAQKYCGKEVDTSFLDDSLDIACAEYNLCADPGTHHTPVGPDDAAALELAENFNPEATGAFVVPPVAPPDPYFPEDKACPTDNCVAPNNVTHPWCHYDVTEGLAPAVADSLDKPVNTGGVPGSSGSTLTRHQLLPMRPISRSPSACRCHCWLRRRSSKPPQDQHFGITSRST